MRTRTFGTAIGGALLLFACVACGSDAPPTGPWQLAEGTTAEGAIPLDDAWPVTLRFEDGSIKGTAACNHYGTRASINGTSLRLAEGGLTNMYCPADDFEVMATESRYLEALWAANGIEQTSETFTLTGPDIELTFRPLTEPPVADLVGRTWVLDSLAGTEDGTSEPVGTPAELEITEDTLRADTGCGEFSGRWIIRGEQILVNYAASETPEECAEDVVDQHGHLINILGDGFRPDLDGDRLSLISAGGRAAEYRDAG
ncbi:META domain-containing protein [Actinoalloteichus hymeniacidonis]|uniref:Heat shock protein n=1 Tax=Actinoalloteichus hymeniacidonis TaxID=340345 RepID=A0AAC9HPZ3_9PSEU|nr:META domain-containing protein [Actinoalloteichus hymeniacidonis]AOS63412.1 heat shock protein [Actinoalloteichus hymeniacidonis]MBB5908547.1 heat shock protein HslJ [Actinoalloteichus hymeniacidonis]